MAEIDTMHNYYDTLIRTLYAAHRSRLRRQSQPINQPNQPTDVTPQLSYARLIAIRNCGVWMIVCFHHNFSIV